MENSKILMKEKLGFIDLLKESIKIYYQNPKFIILTFLTSLPLFCFMLIHELWFQKTVVKAIKFMSHKPDFDNMNLIYVFQHRSRPVGKLLNFFREFGFDFLQLSVMYLPLIHLPELISTITVVSSSSDLYSGHKIITSITETVSKSFKRTLITSLYVLSMTFLVFLGLLAMVSQASVFSDTALTWSTLIYGVPFAVLLYMYIQWSNVWSLGIVASILEENRGEIAIGVSGYISRGNRRNGVIVMGILFVWKMSLRLMSTILMFFHQGDDVMSGLMIVGFEVFLVCVGNVMKWVIFMVFFYDCKLRFLEKKVDLEEGKKVDETRHGKNTEEVVDSLKQMLGAESKV